MATDLLPGGVLPPGEPTIDVAAAVAQQPKLKRIDPLATQKLAVRRAFAPEPGFEGLEEVQPAASNAEAGFEGLQEVDPGFEGLPEADKLDYAAPKELLDDDTFKPAQYIAENPDVAKDGVKFQKLLDVYRAKRERGLETGKVLKAAVKEAPGIVGKTLLGARDLAERVLDIGLQPGANALLGALTNQSPEEMAAIQAEAGKQQLKAAGEITAGTEQAIMGLTQLGQQGARKLFGKKVSELNDNELYDQLLLDSEFHKATQDIAQGKGEANKLAGLDADFLSKNGVTLDQDAISNLSLVDPVTLIATAGVFKVVGVGGKILATAATRAGAEAVVTGLQKVAANSVRIAGRAAELTGKGIQKLPLRTPSIGATGAQLASGNVLGAIGTAAAPAIIRQGGRTLEATGRVVAELGEQAVPGFTGPQTAAAARLSKLAASPAGQLTKGAAQGSLVGAITAAPLAAAADESETAGAILGGGAALGAIAGTALAGKQQVARAVAKHYLDPSTIPFDPVESPGYGIDGNLDRTHEAAIGQLPESERNAVNNFREALRDAGGEIYVQDQASYLERVRESLQQQNGGNPLTPEQEALAKTYADTHAVFDTYLTDANGVQRRAVFLNSTAKGLPHDAGHLFQSLLNPERQAQLRQAVFDAYSPEQITEFADAYAKRLGEPDYFSKLGEEAGRDKIADELIAENFSQIFGNAKLSDLKAPPKFLETLGRTAAEAGEALGLDLTDSRTTPDLGAKPSFRLQNILRNASREVLNLPKAEPKAPFLKQGELTLPEAEPKPTEAPKAADITPEAVTPEAVKPEAVTQEAAPVVDETAKRAQERGVDVARELTKDQPEAAAVVETVAKSMDEGNPVLRIEHRGITQEPGAPRETTRQPRRGTQEAGYEALEALQIENRKEAPPEVVSVHEKTFVPVRFVEQGGKATLIAMSMDKVISNLRKVVADAAGKASDLIPYQQENGKLTEAGWNDALADLRAYAENQSHGYRGDGQKLVRPDEGAGLSIPAEDPNFVPTILDEAKANFANLVQGIAPPLTARQVGKQVPGNVKGQLLAELQGRTPEKPAVIRPSDIQKQTFKKPFEGREVKETNPLRNELARRGVKVRDLTEVTERLAAEDIATVERSAGPQQAAPVTDVIRGGFLPKELPDAINAVETATADNWQSLWGPEGSLTKSAFRTGLDLTHPDQLVALKEAQGRMSDLAKLQVEKAKQMGDLDLMQDASRTAMKGQFFREAYEAATDTGSAGNQQGGWRRYFPTEQAPFANKRDFLPATEKGREAQEKGYDLRVTGKPGNRGVTIVKDGVAVGEIRATEDPSKRNGAFVTSASIQKAHRGQGLAEAAYRELLTQLKEDGVKEVGGGVVAPQPLKIRRKIFGDENTKVTDDRGEVPIDQALSEFDEGSLGFNVSNEIKPEMSFLPSDKAVTDALSSDKKEFVGAARGLKPGTLVGLRIDIPAFNRSGVYVQTIHEKASGGSVGKRIGYDSVATVDNPTFFSNETGAEKIRGGAAKFPIATVEGEFNPSREVPTDLEGWTQVGYNPTKHSYFYEKGTEKPVVSGSQAVSAGNTVYVKDPVYGNKADFKFLPEEVAPESQEGPVPVTEGGRSFLPKPGTPEYDAYVDGRIEESKRFPEAIPLEANKDPKTGHYKSEYKDEPNWVRTPYDFSNSPLAKANKVEGDVVASENKYTDALGKKIEEAYHEAKKNPAVEAGETWYSTAREKIQTLLGEDSQLFAELLGATSPNTGVKVNFGYAVEAYNLFKQGYYDKIIEKYREGRTKYEAGELDDFTKETGKTGKEATEKAFLTWWAEKHGLEAKSNRQKPDGEYIKFGMHTPHILRVFDRSWLRGVEGPKTPNFAGNLSGGSFEATIDKWAARLVRRLSHEGMTDKPWRILPPAETGVSDPNFFTAQKAFRKAGEKLGVSPDALQAILWFFEKDLWENKGWDVSETGTAKADYNVLLARTEKTPQGQLDYKKLPPEKKPKKAKAPKADEITGAETIDKGVSAEDIE